jgi:two-component system sensor histidine kinase BaeS
MQLVLFMQPTPIPGTTNRVYFVPHERPEHLESLDRRLLITSAIAILVAVILTFLISRHITRPIEQLTAAVQEMARGRTRTNVPVRGRDEIARLATSFNEMSDAIANQQELRKRMVGDVAHELRTPVTNLRCELESVQDGLATPNIASLHEEVLHLQRLIDDLQELTLADAGGVKLQLQTLDLVAALEPIVKAPIDAQARPIVRADPLRLGQIMRNLLANAAQYNPRVVIRAENGNAIVSVIDSGPGIPPDELEHIFERFYRLDESRTQKGAGLGLAIVRRLVELHGGRVWAENVPGGGAAFTFTIASHNPASLGA